MDTLPDSNEFEDWELLHSDSDFDSGPVNSANQISPQGALIQVNYFSLEPQNQPYIVDNLDDVRSVESDIIDPGFEDSPTRYSSSEPKFTVFEARTEMGFEENEQKEVGFEEIKEIVEKNEEKVADLSKFYSDSGGTDVGSVKFDEHSEIDVEGNLNLPEELVISGEELNKSSILNKKGSMIEKRGLVWWKMPMEFIKYCILRMSPVWSVSVAAAFMGFLILGRRLYTMKRRAKAREIKVTVDDKVMSRAARLNEAFSVVKRVPVIRPSLPAIGSTTTTWPVMGLR